MIDPVPMSQRVPTAPVDTSAAEFVLQPIENYDRIRRVGRVVYVPAARAFLVTGHDDVAAVLRSPVFHALHYPTSWQRISDATGHDHSAAIALLSMMPFAHEGRRHEVLREAMARALAPFARGTDEMRSSVDASLRRAVRDGGFDLADGFACHLLFDVMCDIMLVPHNDRHYLRSIATLSWAVESTISVKERQLVSGHTRDCVDYLRQHAQATKAESSKGLLGLIYGSLPDDEPDKLTSAAVLATVMLVMGNDAVGACVTMGVRRLLQDEKPSVDQRDWSSVSDDAIRYSAPVDYVIRSAEADSNVAGCPIMRGELVFTSMLAADHDPNAFGSDHSVVTARKNVGLAFGAGRHVCVGNRLARTVINMAYESLSRLPPMRLSGPAIHGRGKLVRTITSLPVAFL